MKILIVHELYAPDIAGGGEKLVLELAQGLRKRGHEVAIVTTGNPNLKQHLGIKTVRFPEHRYLMFGRFLSIARIAKEYDIIQTFSFNAALPAYLAGKISKKPVVCTVLGVYGKIWKDLSPYGMVFRLLEKVQLNHPFTRTIFLSEYSKNIGKSIGMEMTNTAVIPVGVDVSKYKSQKKNDYVLFSGRFVRQKGLDLLLDAANFLPDVKFILMGFGPEEKRLRKRAPANVEFSNLRMDSGKPFYDMYGRARVFALTSRGEGFPIVLVEAMASGCAIVSTIPLEYEGVYIPQRSPIMVAKAIKKCLGAKFSMKCGVENMKRAKLYSWDNFVERTLVEYNKIINKN